MAQSQANVHYMVSINIQRNPKHRSKYMICKQTQHKSMPSFIHSPPFIHTSSLFSSDYNCWGHQPGDFVELATFRDRGLKVHTPSVLYAEEITINLAA